MTSLLFHFLNQGICFTPVNETNDFGGTVLSLMNRFSNKKDGKNKILISSFFNKISKLQLIVNTYYAALEQNLHNK